MRENVVKFFDKGMFGYKMLYFVLVLLSFNSLCARTTGLNYLTYIVAFLGAVFLAFRLFRWKNYIDTRGIIFLVLFCGSYALSSLLMRQYGLMENIQAMIWMVIQFFVVYTYDKSRDVSEDKREIKIISWFFIGYTFVLAAAGLIMFVMGYYHYRPVVDNAVITGFLWNRLWGLYSDPNYGAVFSIISCVMAGFFFKTAKKGLRVFLVIHAVLQIAYIALSDSRTGLVAAAVTAAAAMFLLALRFRRLKQMKTVLKGVVSLLLAVILAVGSVGIVLGVQKGGNAFKVWQREIQTQNGEDDKEKEEEEILVGRTEADINNDISNRRFAIWYSGYEIFKTSPLFGISFRYYREYAKDNLPNTYIVNNDFGEFGSMHNAFVDVFVSQGLLGCVILLCFIISVLTALFRRLFKSEDKDYKYRVFLLLCIIPVFVSMMFYSETFYMNTGGAFLFWAFLGYLMHSLTQDTKSKFHFKKIEESHV